MKTCTRCNQTKDLLDFYKNKRRIDGYNSQCKSCSDEMNASVRGRNKDQYNSYRRNWKRELVEKINAWKRDVGCKVCSENEPVCLELHHLDPTEKENHPSLLRTSLDRYMSEASKCIVVCSNCHKKIHAGKIDL